MTSSTSPKFDGPSLPRLARAFLEQHLQGKSASSKAVSPMSIAPGLHEQGLLQHGATFVTLRKNGKLRGCIGSLQASRPLVDDLRANTIAAATRDPRFPAVQPSELDELTLEVSVLTPPENLDLSPDPKTPHLDPESQALLLLRPDVDGVILSWQEHRSTFLPQVWEQLPTAEQFLRELKKKAGLREDFWAPDVELAVYQVEKWVEDEPPSA